MPKHTPGPWDLLTGTISDQSGNEIAEVVGGDGGRYLDDDVNAECAANARLIAAAPELLEALREITDALSDKESRRDIAFALIQKAERAIAKATVE